MRQQTKLVDCGSTILVYDYESSLNITELKLEKEKIYKLKRLLLTNFVNDDLLVSFTLEISLDEYEYIQSKLDHFINRLQISSGRSKIKYLAVLELPSDHHDPYVYLRLITDIKIHELTSALEEDLYGEAQDEYLEEVWGNMILTDVLFEGELLKTYSSAYSNSKKSIVFDQYPKILYKSNLNRPRVLLNEQAHVFIESHLLDYPNHHSNRVYDSNAGIVTINEYSLYHTSSPSDEMSWFKF